MMKNDQCDEVMQGFCYFCLRCSQGQCVFFNPKCAYTPVNTQAHSEAFAPTQSKKKTKQKLMMPFLKQTT